MTGRRFTFEDDLFLHSHFDAVGDYIGVHDLLRPKGAATKRVNKLKKTGAWAAIDKYFEAEKEYRRCLGLPCHLEDEAP